MSLKIYDATLGQWIVVAPSKKEFDTHVEKMASATELGHVKVDNSTIAISTDGVISVIGGNAEVADATTLIKGIVQLSNDIASDSELLAATPKAVKDAIAQMQTFTQTEIANLIGSAPEVLDTIEEIATAIQTSETTLQGLITVIAEKATQADLQAHTDNTEIHVTQADKDKWNAGSNIHVGTEAPTDTTLVWLSVEE